MSSNSSTDINTYYRLQNELDPYIQSGKNNWNNIDTDQTGQYLVASQASLISNEISRVLVPPTDISYVTVASSTSTTIIFNVNVTNPDDSGPYYTFEASPKPYGVDYRFYGVVWNTVLGVPDLSLNVQDIIQRPAISYTGKYQLVPTTSFDSNLQAKLYYSRTYGKTWSIASQETGQYLTAHMSADGKYQYHDVYDYATSTTYLKSSSDYGQTWGIYPLPVFPPNELYPIPGDIYYNYYYITGFAVSYTGQYHTLNYTYVDYTRNTATAVLSSSDYGQTWTFVRTPGGTLLAMSGNGKYRITCGYNDKIYISKDYGSTWSLTFGYNILTTGCAVSYTGKYQIVVGLGATAYVSSDFGQTWFNAGLNIAIIYGYNNLYSVSISRNGDYITATGIGTIYSTDYGITWANYGQTGGVGVAVSGNAVYQIRGYSSQGNASEILLSILDGVPGVELTPDPIVTDISLNFEFTGLTPSTTYVFRVVANNIIGTETFPVTIEASTKSVYIVANPTIETTELSSLTAPGNIGSNNFIAVAKNNRNLVYVLVGEQAGCMYYKSNNGGTTFSTSIQPVAYDIPNAVFRSLKCSYTGQYVYFVKSDVGFCRSEDYGETFTFPTNGGGFGVGTNYLGNYAYMDCDITGQHIVLTNSVGSLFWSSDYGITFSYYLYENGDAYISPPVSPNIIIPTIDSQRGTVYIHGNNLVKYSVIPSGFIDTTDVLDISMAAITRSVPNTLNMDSRAEREVYLSSRGMASEFGPGNIYQLSYPTVNAQAIELIQKAKFMLYIPSDLTQYLPVFSTDKGTFWNSLIGNEPFMTSNNYSYASSITMDEQYIYIYFLRRIPTIYNTVQTYLMKLSLLTTPIPDDGLPLVYPGVLISNTVYTYTGEDQPLIIPTGTKYMEVEIWGGGGASGSYSYGVGPIGTAYSGGGGGYASATIAVTTDDTISVMVAAGGESIQKSPNFFGAYAAAYGGGGVDGPNSTVMGGGGRSALRKLGIVTPGVYDDILTAGGGGRGQFALNSIGGAGGGTIGQDFYDINSYAGRGGTQTEGGLAGYGGGDGSKYQGGYAGGGGGYYGGGGGSYGGGGGSGYYEPSVIVSGSPTPSLVQGNGNIVGNYGGLPTKYQGVIGVGAPPIFGPEITYWDVPTQGNNGGPGLVIIRFYKNP